MGIYSNVKTLAGLWADKKKRQLQEATPNTRIDSGGSQGKYSWQGQELDRGELRDVKQIRESGGVVSHLVHAKALMQFGTGVTFESDEEEVAEYLRDNFNDIDNLLIDLGEDAIWYPYAAAEVVETRGGSFSHVECVEPYTLLPITDEFGEVVAWEQEISGDYGSNTERFEPDEIASFVLNKSSGRDKTGISEVMRAEQEIEGYRQNAEAINQAIDNAAWPRRLWKVGREDGGVIDDNELRRVRNRVDDLGADTDIVAGPHIDANTLEAQNFEFDKVTEHDLRKLALALGLPLELANVGSDGLGSGMPAELRKTLFERQARAAQRALADQFVQQVIRPVLEEYSPYPRDVNVELRFGDPLEDEETDLSEKAPYMTTNELREQFDLPPEEDEEIGESYRKPANIQAPEEEEPEDDGIGSIFGEDGEQEATLADGGDTDFRLEEFESWLDDAHENFVQAEETGKTLTTFSESQLPEMVKTRIREAIMGGAIFSDIESIPSGELMDFRQSLSDMLTDDEWSLDNMAGELSDRFGVDEDRAETIARTETQSIVNHAAEDAYQELEEERGEEFRFKWVGSVDNRTTEACEWLLEQTNPSYGGDPVSLERLKELIQEAPEHDPDIETEPREFTPHIGCRKRYVRVVE